MNKDKQFDLYFSIGQACSCSGTLRKQALQFLSYPFDWLSGANITERAKILTSDFQDWLNKEDLEKIGENCNSKTQNWVYKNNKTGICFNHDFFQNIPFDEMYEEVNAKYERRISRLLKSIKKSKRVLAVYLQAPNNNNEISDEELLNILKILQNKFGEKINLLYLYSEPNRSFNDKKVISLTPHLTKVVFDYNAYNPEIPYDINKKVLHKWFREYSITTRNLTFRNLLVILGHSIKIFVREKITKKL